MNNCNAQLKVLVIQPDAFLCCLQASNDDGKCASLPQDLTNRRHESISLNFDAIINLTQKSLFTAETFVKNGYECNSQTVSRLCSGRFLVAQSRFSSVLLPSH